MPWEIFFVTKRGQIQKIYGKLALCVSATLPHYLKWMIRLPCTNGPMLPLGQACSHWWFGAQGNKCCWMAVWPGNPPVATISVAELRHRCGFRRLLSNNIRNHRALPALNRHLSAAASINRSIFSVPAWDSPKLGIFSVCAFCPLEPRSTISWRRFPPPSEPSTTVTF